MSDKLQEIRERLEKATPGPWEVGTGCGRFIYPKAIKEISIGSVSGGDDLRQPLLDKGFVSRSPERIAANAEFIANAPTDITYLLSRLLLAEKLATALRHAVTMISPNRAALSNDGEKWFGQSESALSAWEGKK